VCLPVLPPSLPPSVPSLNPLEQRKIKKEEEVKAAPQKKKEAEEVSCVFSLSSLPPSLPPFSFLMDPTSF